MQTSMKLSIFLFNSPDILMQIYELNTVFTLLPHEKNEIAMRWQNQNLSAIYLNITYNEDIKW